MPQLVISGRPENSVGGEEQGPFCESMGALGMDLRAPDLDIEIDFDLSLAWFDRRRDMLNPLPPGALERLLPGRLGRSMAKARVAEDLGHAITRNVEKLRWSLQQAIEEAFRTFQHRLDEALDQVAAATGEATALALTRRRERADEAESETQERREFRGALSRALASFADDRARTGEKAGPSDAQGESLRT